MALFGTCLPRADPPMRVPSRHPLRPRMRARAPILLGLGIVAVTSTACGKLPGRGGLGAAPESGVRVEVENLHWRDVTVYVTRGSARRRLGLVTSNSTRTFGLSKEFIAGGYQVSLFAAVVGSNESLRPPAVAVSPGDIVVWLLRPALNQSVLSVWPGGGVPVRDTSGGVGLSPRP